MKSNNLKAYSAKSSYGVIVMEDLSVVGQEGSVESDLQVDVIMKFLQILAFIHAKSLETSEVVGITNSST